MRLFRKKGVGGAGGLRAGGRRHDTGGQPPDAGGQCRAAGGFHSVSGEWHPDAGRQRPAADDQHPGAGEQCLGAGEQCPAVSVIVPVYNTAAFLGKCVESLLAQTFPDFELILVDDGSTDGSGALCDAFAARDARVRVVHKSNGGVSSARNRGIELARGEYLWFCDSDDWVEGDALAVLVERARATGAQVVVLSVQMEDEQGNPLGVVDAPAIEGVITDGPLQCGNELFPYANFLRRDVVGESRFSEDLALLEDRDFLYRVLVRSKARCAATPRTLYHYVITRAASAVNKPFSSQYLKAQKVHLRILQHEIACGHPHPAYEIYADFTLTVLGEICKTGMLRDHAAALRRELQGYGAYAGCLSGRVRLKYVLLVEHPRVAQLAFRGYGRIKRRKPGDAMRRKEAKGQR